MALGRSGSLLAHVCAFDQQPQNDRELPSGSREHRHPLVEDNAVASQKKRRKAVRDIRHASDEAENAKNSREKARSDDEQSERQEPQPPEDLPDMQERLPAAQVNEVLCKILAHNICCLIQHV